MLTCIKKSVRLGIHQRWSTHYQNFHIWIFLDTLYVTSVKSGMLCALTELYHVTSVKSGMLCALTELYCLTQTIATKISAVSDIWKWKLYGQFYQVQTLKIISSINQTIIMFSFWLFFFLLLDVYLREINYTFLDLKSFRLDFSGTLFKQILSNCALKSTLHSRHVW